MKNKEQLISGLTPEERKQLLNHFDEIYVCDELTTHEENMIYLAYLWKNGKVAEDYHGFLEVDDDVKDLKFEDYEQRYEHEGTDGVNLYNTYSYYMIDEMMKLLPE